MKTYEIEDVKKYLKGLDTCYKAIWKKQECKHIHYHFFYFVIQDGKCISRHKSYDRALKANQRN